MKQLLNYINNYKDFFTLIFIFVIFSNLGVGNFLLSDIIYGAIAFWTVIKFKKTPYKGLVLAFFLIVTIVNYISYGNSRALLSTIRFDYGLIICAILFSNFDNDNYRNRLINGYCYACVFFSAFVIIQFVSYYVLKINIDFSFGDYAREENAAGAYDVLSDMFYRTGGMFKEPSWYAAYVSPVSFILTKQKRFKELFICLVGLLASTSGLGFAILAIYVSWLALLYDKKMGITVALFVFLVYQYLPFIFNKMSTGALGEESSLGIRVMEPFTVLSNLDFSFIGLNPIFHYDNSGHVMFFLNTFMFVYFYYGILGSFLFLNYIKMKNIRILFIAIVAITLIEGIYGRIEFWMMLLACLLYNSSLSNRNKIMK